MLLALGGQAPGVEFDGVSIARVAAGGPFSEACAVPELDCLVSLVGHEPGPVGVVLADCVAVLTHEHMFALASKLATAVRSRSDWI